MATSKASPGPEDNILTLCHMLSNRIGKAFASEMELYDVSVGEWRVLLTLAQHAPVSGKEITDRWAMDKMAINRAIASLQTKNFISKKPNEDDKRVIDLYLTDTGETLYEQILPLANERYHSLFAGIDKQQEKQLQKTLRTLIAEADTEIN